jgi:RHH-type proline utilization regulon transcriptional repressor/proline dehydrogenase/delta 1-pyrroline-5-carboxylate dehydrogenase
VLHWGGAEQARPHAVALAQRQGPILSLITGQPDAAHLRLERHICIDTTASGGNAQLLAQAAQA